MICGITLALADIIIILFLFMNTFDCVAFKNSLLLFSCLAQLVKWNILIVILLLKVQNISTCRWVSSWLPNKTLSVTVHCAKSSQHMVIPGVLQGGVLGPVLFLVYIHDIRSCKIYCNPKLFADDFLAYHQINSHVDVDNFQSDLNKLTMGRYLANELSSGKM